jgi:heme-degrading monooxygenase HmoA
MITDMTRRTTIAFAAAMLLACVMPRASAAEPPSVVHQLRVYEIFENNKQAFHERFRDHAMRIMARHGFKIIAIWETKHKDRTEFVYLLQWPDRATLTASWAKFMADQEWSDIKKRTGAVHGRMVGEIQDRVLEVQDYSPLHALQLSRQP